MSYANHYDKERAVVMAEREADWRNGAIVYQVIVDRFAPPEDIEAKRSLYPPPKTLESWDTPPTKGVYLPDAGVWSHEIAFWGGDLDSLRSRMRYINDLGVDVLYLNPIHKAYTNHKYDAQDYFEVSPEYGSREDVRELAGALHERGMHLVLDGVFNHMGRTSPMFQDALKNPDSKWRDWFFIGRDYKYGYRAWANVENLPELNLENPKVQARIFGNPDSVVQGYLRDGVDGWRLDVAFDIGFAILNKLTLSAHEAKPGSLVIGEIWNYPEEWSPALDGVMNFHARQIIQYLVEGEVSGAQAAKLFNRMVEDAGLDAIMKSWLILDNHDTPRLKNMMPEQWKRRMAQTLQFTLPGSPNLYYGVELGMEGGEDPANRAPMRWDLATDKNPELQWMRSLIAMRKSSRALRIGDFRLLDSDRLLAFLRYTDRVRDTRIIVANNSDKEITEVIGVRDSKLMNWAWMHDLLGDARVQLQSGTARVTVPPQTIWVLAPEIADTNEYTPYKRVQ